jgi:hypothetical protein
MKFLKTDFLRFGGSLCYPSAAADEKRAGKSPAGPGDDQRLAPSKFWGIGRLRYCRALLDRRAAVVEGSYPQSMHPFSLARVEAALALQVFAGAPHADATARAQRIEEGEGFNCGHDVGVKKSPGHKVRARKRVAQNTNE